MSVLRLRSVLFAGVSSAALIWLFAPPPAASADSSDDAYDWKLPVGFPKPYVPPDNPMTAAKVELGRYLFYDTRMSVNGTEACASCHKQELAFTDGRPVGIGATGEHHTRSAMSLVNVAYSAALTWSNPRLKLLEEQALTPMLGDHPVELGLKEGDQFLPALRRSEISIAVRTGISCRYRSFHHSEHHTRHRELRAQHHFGALALRSLPL
jgi:cytochrome c peroxidase